MVFHRHGDAGQVEVELLLGGQVVERVLRARCGVGVRGWPPGALKRSRDHARWPGHRPCRRPRSTGPPRLGWLIARRARSSRDRAGPALWRCPAKPRLRRIPIRGSQGVDAHHRQPTHLHDPRRPAGPGRAPEVCDPRFGQHEVTAVLVLAIISAAGLVHPEPCDRPPRCPGARPAQALDVAVPLGNRIAYEGLSRGRHLNEFTAPGTGSAAPRRRLSAAAAAAASTSTSTTTSTRSLPSRPRLLEHLDMLGPEKIFRAQLAGFI